MQEVNDEELQNVYNLFLTRIKTLELSKDWHVKQEKPIVVFEKKIADRIVFKGVTVVNIPFNTVLKFFSDPGFVQVINKEQVLKFEMLYDNKALRVVYVMMRMPGPVTNREILAVNTVKVEGNKAYIGSKS